MISRFFVLSGAVLNVKPLRLVIVILTVSAVISAVISGLVAAFPRAALNVMTDTFESTVLQYGTEREIDMMRQLRHGEDR